MIPGKVFDWRSRYGVSQASIRLALKFFNSDVPEARYHILFQTSCGPRSGGQLSANMLSTIRAVKEEL
jgi:hypothetical protein